tara:strand:- start:517 stop:771 length:255 start_codon:yes stop_codon:yes gene_type:complete
MKNDKILKTIIKFLEKRGSITEKKNILSYNFIKKGHIDSLNSIKFIFELEDKFKIKFTKKEINSSQFEKIGSLVNIIKKKVKKK